MTRLSPCNCPAKDEPGATHAHYCVIEFQYPIALALDSAKEAGRREDRWQPIETAPRNGTHVLVTVCGAVYKARLFGGSHCQKDGGYSGHAIADLWGWQPLPEPAKPAIISPPTSEAGNE